MRSFAELPFTVDQVCHKTPKHFVSRLRDKLGRPANMIIALRGFGIVWQQLAVGIVPMKVINTATARHCQCNTKCRFKIFEGAFLLFLFLKAYFFYSISIILGQ